MKLLHLLRDTIEFVDDLRRLHWQDGMRMVKTDVKEFYMSGKPGFLSHACSELYCDETEDFKQLVASSASTSAASMRRLTLRPERAAPTWRMTRQSPPQRILTLLNSHEQAADGIR